MSHELSHALTLRTARWTGSIAGVHQSLGSVVTPIVSHVPIQLVLTFSNLLQALCGYATLDKERC